MAQQSIAVRTAKQAAIETTIGASPKLALFGGAAKPVDCAAADAGTQLSIAALPADWATQANGVLTMAGAWSGTATVAGYVRYFRLKDGAATTCHLQGLVSEPWAASKAYPTGVHAHNGGNVYVSTVAGISAAAGGPAGTGAGIVDGGVTWDYVGPVDMTIDNTNLAANQAWSVSAFTNTDNNG